ncbi:tRNA (adenosine(37)-N6)-threonylcarbamoyltransferase complex transferase subunit TsaD [Candidatus Gracilibacteria bacterium]|nr:tRNA (adenosine(37)-N6)-threonylcarbamoyltransferase complex transferase subunit TsaD [Candidatus Gracilibacteria bacterium]
MLILGIESSCDETSVAVVKDGREILCNVIHSQIDMHRETGGVVPEVAAREHAVKMLPVLENALKQAKIKLTDLDAIAVTYGPGLIGSLLVGVNCAVTLAAVLKIPLIPVNHIEGHMYANFIGRGKMPEFPLVVLTASGGHNELVLWKDHGKYRFLGATMDDAAGEAFDKVARLLGLPYPGGPAIQKTAVGGDPNRYPLPRAWVTPWDFSFSGLKTAVLRLVQAQKKSMSPTTYDLPPEFVRDAAASFQESVCDVLATKLANAAKKFKVKEAHLAGGVSANKRLRERARELLPENVQLKYCEDLKLCTDNAAMIATCGYYRYKKSPAQFKTWRPVSPDPNLAIKNWPTKSIAKLKN